MKTGCATVANQYGIHCRPSTLIVKEAQAYPGKITVTVDEGAPTNAKNILGLLGLAITCGKTVTITVAGPDEDLWLDKMVRLFSTDFDFRRE